MSRRSGPGRYSESDEVGNGAYADFLSGGNFKNNPTRNRKTLMKRMYTRILTELSANRFKWTGLPDSVDPRFLELTLFYNALSVFYWDTTFDQFFSLRAAGSGYLNFVGNPTSYTVMGNNFVSKTLSAAQVVPIWANFLRIPDMDIVWVYAEKLAELDYTIEVNSKNARVSRVIVANENNRLSLINVERMLREGDETVMIQNAALLDSIIPLNMQVPTNDIEKLHIVRTRLWNECMGLLGIDNANQDKKERLVAAEVGANDEQISATKAVNLNARKYACDQINKKYGDLLPKGPISVDYQTPPESVTPLAGLTPDMNMDGDEQQGAEQ